MKKMGDIVNLIEEKGHRVVKVILKGHKKNAWKDFLKATKEDWERDIIDGYKKLSGRKHIVGYSLGGLLGVYVLKRHPEMKVTSMVLFAPAIKAPWYGKLIYPLSWLGLKSLPSFAPRDERVHESTPIHAYKEVLDIQREVRELGEAFPPIPVTMFIDKRDGLVSYGKIKNWLKKEKLSSWRMILVEASRGAHHMIIQKRFLSSMSWEKISSQF